MLRCSSRLLWETLALFLVAMPYQLKAVIAWREFAILHSAARSGSKDIIEVVLATIKDRLDPDEVQ